MQEKCLVVARKIWVFKICVFVHKRMDISPTETILVSN